MIDSELMEIRNKILLQVPWHPAKSYQWFNYKSFKIREDDSGYYQVFNQRHQWLKETQKLQNAINFINRIITTIDN